MSPADPSYSPDDADPKPAPDDRTPKLLLQALFIRGTWGFTLGLYLYTYTATILAALGDAKDPSTRVLYGLLFTFGILLEALLEIPCGAWADIAGYRATLKIAFAVRCAFFFALYGVSQFTNTDLSEVLCFSAIAIFSLSYALWSGTFSSWLYASLQAQGRAASFARYLAVTSIAYNTTFIVGAILSSALYFAGRASDVYLTGAACCLVASIASGSILWVPSSRFRFEDRSMRQSIMAYRASVVAVVRQALQFFLRRLRLFHLMVLSAAATLVTYITDWTVAPYAATTWNIERLSTQWLVMILVLTVGNLIGGWLMLLLPVTQDTHAERRCWRLLLVSVAVFASSCLSIACLSYAGAFASASHFYLFLSLLLVSKISETTREIPYDYILNQEIAAATIVADAVGKTDMSPNDARTTILSCATFFNAAFVMVFFVPSTALSEAAGADSWMMPSAVTLVLVVILAIRRPGQLEVNKP